MMMRGIVYLLPYLDLKFNDRIYIHPALASEPDRYTIFIFNET
jgi:hypothetical protein